MAPGIASFLDGEVKKRSSQSCPLLFAASDSDADQLWFSRFFVPDPFVSFAVGGKKIGVLNALEIARGRKESALDDVLPLDEWRERAKKQYRASKPGMAEIIALLAREHGITRFRVGPGFPLGLARQLEKRRLVIEVAEGGLFPERERKSAEEAEHIRKGNRCSAAGLRAAEKVLRAAAIRNGRLLYDGKPLTSERLKEEIEIACLRAGAVSSHTIAAGGDQACDPHCSGSGPLRANELIIVDVFPRVTATGYYGDMTRTFLKGKPTDAQRDLVETVREAQARALKEVKAGASANKIHNGVVDHFNSRGYETKTGGDVPVGFFHGTGHGLGMEVHEAPRLSKGAGKLKSGQVVTVEPGLYYPGLGAARIEDVAWVRPDGCELLSSYPYRWVIR